MHRNSRPDARYYKSFDPFAVFKSRRNRAFHSLVAGGEAGDILVASYNIHKCVGLDGTFDAARTAEVIKEIDADVIALQEVDQRVGKRAGLLDLHALERDTGLRAVKMTGAQRSHGWRGNLLLVREGTVTGSRQVALSGGEPRGALVVDIEFPAGPLRVVAAHLGLLRRSRMRQVKTLLSAAKADEGYPTLLMGDLNEWRLGKRSSLRALDSSFGPLQAAVPSFPARFPVWSLDRIVANRHDMISRIELHDTPLARIASDHLPIKAAIRLGDSTQPDLDLTELASAA
jgi:endonuclease/exonuclease/phosphatase family metal-dependent hydrolase